MRALLPIIGLSLVPCAVAAQPICLAPDARLPFIDGEVISCAEETPRLTLVREEALYDPDLGEWRQAILLRFANPLDEELIVSGVLDLEGAELIGEPDYLAADLRRSDFEWAVAPLSHYEDPGDCSARVAPPGPHPGRGLEFGDLMRYGADGVRFEFAAAADLDDIRMVLSSPDPAPAGAVVLTLFDVLTSPGVQIQVGAVDADLTADDGVYPVDAPVIARLRVLDLDIPEACVANAVDQPFGFELQVPEIPPQRPAAGDPRLDRNGDTSPVDALAAPIALRWRPTELVGPQGDTLLVAALDGLDPGLCADGQLTLPLTAWLEPADGLPPGVYSGTIDVWEDLDGNRRFDRGEIGDTVRIAATVGAAAPDDPCAEPAEPDAGLGPDLDAGLDAAIDGGALDGALDAGSQDSAADGSADAGALDGGFDSGDAAAQDAQPAGDDAAPLDGGLDGAPSDLGSVVDRAVDGALDPADGARDGGREDVEPSDGPRTDGEPLDGGLIDGLIDDGATPDGDLMDGGSLDGAVDARVDGGGTLDGAAPDGFPQDDAQPDASADGAVDATASDAALPDASVDATPLDATALPDLAPTDGFIAADADALDGPLLDAADAADPGDPKGGALSCRATPGASSPPGLWILALGLFGLGYARRRAYMAAATAALLLVSLLLAPRAADAQADVRRFAPTPTTSPYVNLDGAGTLGAGDVAARLISVIEQRPLVFARDGDRTVDIISIRLGLDAAFAVGLTDWLDVGVGLPLVLLQDGRQVNRDTALPGFALADPSLGAKVRLLPTSAGVGLALRVGGTAPLGDGDALVGEAGPTGTAMLALEFPVSSRFDIVLDVGYRLREATRLGDIDLDDELLFGLGASWRATPDFALAVELSGATAAAAPFSVEQQTPGGLDLLARVGIVDDLAAVAGAGLGLLPGYGSPMFRAVAGLQYTPRNHDFDGDGLADRRDDCVETVGVPLERGCPAPAPIAVVEETAPSRDKDGDDILDALDQCPYLPEDRDGFRDDDGCPDADNDLDLLADSFDADPLGPEDWDAFEDGDGIPDPDNDRDGIADFRDRCPDEPGGADGCPGSLRPDAPSSGGDALADADGPQAPLVLGRTLHPAEPIIFEFARPELTTEAGPLVDGLARYLIEHPELDRVEVGVHVDAMGSRRWKHWLSRARAESVVAALTARGVPAERVFPRGYGPEVPVDTNRTKAGRYNNRRVELRALRAFEEARPTRATERRRTVREPRRKSVRPGRLPPPRPRWLPPDTLVLRPTAPLAFVRGDTLAPRSMPRVAEFAARLTANPDWRRVEVAVHTDGAGDPDEKLRSSQRRAEAVVEALVARGVANGRLIPRGYGARRRLLDDESADSRAVNRRVELVVLDASVSLAPGGEP